MAKITELDDRDDRVLGHLRQEGGPGLLGHLDRKSLDVLPALAIAVGAPCSSVSGFQGRDHRRVFRRRGLR